MNDQNTATANRLKTLTHTKNTRATHTGSMSRVSEQPEQREVGDEELVDDGDEAAARQPRHQRAVQRLQHQQRHEGGGEEPGQRLRAAGDGHLVAQRPQHVVRGEQREEIGERPERRLTLSRSCRNGSRQPPLQRRHGVSDSFCLSSAA